MPNQHSHKLLLKYGIKWTASPPIKKKKIRKEGNKSLNEAMNTFSRKSTQVSW